MKSPFSVQQWIAWAGALIVAMFGLMNFAYSTFQTQREASHLEKRLERIEGKIDSLVELSRIRQR